MTGEEKYSMLCLVMTYMIIQKRRKDVHEHVNMNITLS